MVSRALWAKLLWNHDDLSGRLTNYDALSGRYDDDDFSGRRQTSLRWRSSGPNLALGSVSGSWCRWENWIVFYNYKMKLPIISVVLGDGFLYVKFPTCFISCAGIYQRKGLRRGKGFTLKNCFSSFYDGTFILSEDSSHSVAKERSPVGVTNGHWPPLRAIFFYPQHISKTIQ